MKIKICGLTNPKEAKYLNENHVDFAGFVLFFPKSKRNNTLEQAEKIAIRLDDTIRKAAVVVSPSAEEIRQIEASKAGFDYIQIHGALSEELLASIHLPILKAFNVSDMADYPLYHECPKVAGYVFDAAEPGSGKTFDWSLVKEIPRDEKLLLLAGGLCAENVCDAIAAIQPDGVDVSSGVEYTDRPGKNPLQIEQFVRNVRGYGTTDKNSDAAILSE
jgi:phosphoribosylanthranilate isomerase